MLKESKGNMYDWVTHTWNPIKGICKHKCEYCYMKIKPKKNLMRLLDFPITTLSTKNNRGE